MAVQVALPGMRRVNYHVDGCCYAAEVGIDGIVSVDFPAPVAANATNIMNAQSIATAGSAGPAATFSSALMSRYGRNVTVVASGAATSNVTIAGYDYLGQPIKESFTLTGATPVVGKKMFADIVGATFGATAATTINVGFGAVLGLPYKAVGSNPLFELTAGANPGTPGVIVPGVDVQTITSGDPRGTYAPNAVPDGAKTYRLTYMADRNNLHGNAHVIV